MKLYSFFNSSTSYRVRITLALKGLDYEYNGVNIRIGEETAEDYIKMAPGKGVPLLVDDQGMHLSQSLAILSYLDDTHPEPRLIPTEPLLKARVLEFSSIIACDIHPVNNIKILKYLQQELSVSDEQKKAWYNHWIKEGLGAVEALLARNNQSLFCFGEEPTLADVCLVPQIANAQRMKCDLLPYNNLMRIYDHCQTLPAFQAAAPSQQPDFSA